MKVNAYKLKIYNLELDSEPIFQLSASGYCGQNTSCVATSIINADILEEKGKGTRVIWYLLHPFFDLTCKRQSRLTQR